MIIVINTLQEARKLCQILMDNELSTEMSFSPNRKYLVEIIEKKDDKSIDKT